MAEGLEMNSYAVLGLDKGPESTDEEIKKAYRKKALQLHPDKNRDKPGAAEDFSRLQVAYELLCNAAAKESLDQLLRAQQARKQRLAGASEKRRKMAADLERREQTWQRQDREERDLKAKLKAEIERLRERERLRSAQQRQEAATAAAAAFLRGEAPASPAFAGAIPVQAPGGAPQGAAASPQVSAQQLEELTRTLKVSWELRHGSYTAQQLRAAFAAHGPVADVVLREPKKRRPSKGSALVVMATPQGAAAAAAHPHGDAGNPLLVLPFSKVPSVEEAYRSSLGGTPPASPPLSPLRGTPPPSNGAAAQGAPEQPQQQQSQQQRQQQPSAQDRTPSSSGPSAGQEPQAPRSEPPLPYPARSFPLSSVPGPAPGKASRLGQAGAEPRRSSFPGLASMRAGQGGTAAAPPQGPAFGAAHTDFESVTLMQMRRKAERDRLLREAEAEEQAEREGPARG